MIINTIYKLSPMRSIILLIFAAILPFWVSSQELTRMDGKFYKNGMLYTGTHIEYYDNGHRKSEQSFKNGLYDGKSVFYFENGQVKEERHYQEGRKHGCWLTFNLQGLENRRSLVQKRPERQYLAHMG